MHNRGKFKNKFRISALFLKKIEIIRKFAASKLCAVLKKFLLQSLLLLGLTLSGLVGIETLTRNSFDTVRFKYRWLKENAGRMETLVLGPSTMFYDVNPALFSSESFNAAFSDQQPEYDWLMFTADTAGMTSLRNVILDITSEYINKEEKKILTVPYRIYCGRKEGFFDLYSLEISSPVRCRNKIKNKLAYADSLHCNEAGWQPVKVLKSEKELQESSRAIARKRIALYGKAGGEYPDYPGMLMDYCQRHGIRIILVRPPVYCKYKELVDREVNFTGKMDSLATIYLRKYDNAIYADYSSDPRFGDSDFRDAIHLNSDGATKWSEILKEDHNL